MSLFVVLARWDAGTWTHHEELHQGLRHVPYVHSFSLVCLDAILRWGSMLFPFSAHLSQVGSLYSDLTHWHMPLKLSDHPISNLMEDTLNLDGTTDGGCETVDPIDADDKYGKCPTTDTAPWHFSCHSHVIHQLKWAQIPCTAPLRFEATTDCASFYAPSAEVSMEMLAIIVGSTGGVIACCAVLGIMLVRHVQPFGCHDVNDAIQGLQAFGFGSMLQISLDADNSCRQLLVQSSYFIEYSTVNVRLNTSVYSTTMNH